MIAAIDWGTLGHLVWAAPLAALAVALVYSLVILGVARTDDARRRGATIAAGFYSVFTVAALAGFVGLVIYGISVITTK